MWKKIAKAAVFLLIFFALFLGVSKVLTAPGDYRNYQWIAGFYQEPKESLDAVYVSSSTCYAYWNPLTAWENHGVAVYPYTCNSQHFIAAEYLIREARKTQPDALYIVNTNTIDSEKLVVEEFHYTLDYMPFSLNKLRLTKRLADAAGLSVKERLELYVPLYRYHDRWSEINSYDFYYPLNGLKGAANYSTYMNTSMDLSGMYTQAEGVSALPGYIRDAAVSLMDYCEKEGVRILFVTVPRVESEERIRELNELNAMLEAQGFDTLNLLDQPDRLKIDLTQDFYNDGHTNVHGSLKFTEYLCEYLTEHYGLEDHRGDPKYASWDAGYEKYMSRTQDYALDEYTLDIEYDLQHRTNELEMPVLSEIREEDGARIFSWSPSDGAAGYLVYRREHGKAWEPLGETSDTVYTDETADPALSYDYTSVPYLESDGERLYGAFDYHCRIAESQ